MSKKSKKIERKVRKALRKDLATKLNTVIGQIASGLEVNSKKTKKTIAKISKQLSTQLSDKVNVAAILNQEKVTKNPAAAEAVPAVTPEEKKTPVKAKPVTRRTASVRKPQVKPISEATPVLANDSGSESIIPSEVAETV